MYKPDYPEWGRREAMLWGIHEWVQDRPAGEDLIWIERFATLVGGGIAGAWANSWYRHRKGDEWKFRQRLNSYFSQQSE